MPLQTVERVAAITATLHDGKHMIVLSAGKKVTVAVESLEFLEGRKALEPVDGVTSVLDDEGNPVGITDAEDMEPAALSLTDDERANLPQLDHDGDGEPGGSISAGDDEAMKALRVEYTEVVGKRPFGGWDEAELRRRMSEHQQSNPAGDEDAPPA